MKSLPSLRILREDSRAAKGPERQQRCSFGRHPRCSLQVLHGGFSADGLGEVLTLVVVLEAQKPSLGEQPEISGH